QGSGDSTQPEAARQASISPSAGRVHRVRCVKRDVQFVASGLELPLRMGWRKTSLASSQNTCGWLVPTSTPTSATKSPLSVNSLLCSDMSGVGDEADIPRTLFKRRG